MLPDYPITGVHSVSPNSTQIPMQPTNTVMNAKHIEGALNLVYPFQGAGSRDSIPSTSCTQNPVPSITSQSIPLANEWGT